jgi:hypothetical protein
MRFELNKIYGCGMLLSLCSLPAFADDTNPQNASLGTAIGSFLGGAIHQVIAPTHTNFASPAQTEIPVASMQQQPNPFSQMSAEDQELLAKGLWHDSSTGLTWSLCRVGETWSGSSCEGTPTQLDWVHALFSARDSRLAGYDDWRVPSFSEYAGIIRCPTGFDESEYGRTNEARLKDAANDVNGVVIKSCKPISDHERQTLFHILPDQFSFLTLKDSSYPNVDFNRMEFVEWTSSYTLDMNKTHFYPVMTNASTAMSNTSDRHLGTRLVRGGTAGSYQQALQTASTVLKNPMIRAKAAQAKQDDLTRRTALLRQNVKEGDKTTQGLVIEVKGSLVKLQTYNRVCVAMNEFTNPPVCTRSQSVAAGEAWVNRNELTPIQ